ncbi:hypothetical protein Plec18170_006562 [Paecilomyces lecythidis]
MDDDRGSAPTLSGDLLCASLPYSGLDTSLNDLPDWPSADNLFELEPLDSDLSSTFMSERLHDDLWCFSDSCTTDCLGWACSNDIPQTIEPGVQSAPLTSVGAAPDLNDNPVGKDTSNRKKYRRLPRNAVIVLRSWLHQHKDYPYPTQWEKENLQQETGLSNAQISDWFMNARRRKLAGGKSTSEAKPLDISQQSPLERWKNSPPQSEAAATSDIMRALTDIPFSYDQNGTLFDAPQHTNSSNSSSASFAVGAPSVSSFEHSQSSGSEMSFGQLSQPSSLQRVPTPMPRQSPRRQRRKPRPAAARNVSKTDRLRLYQCTFCTDSFRTKYDWARHEKALHLSVDCWPCAPQGGIVDIDGVSVCVFCREPGADDDHLNEHDYLACREKEREQRTFYRKDHLRQHLTLLHKVDYHSSMDQWHENLAWLVSRCGFCDATFTSWQDRVNHVAQHFKGGADMVQWRGDWGFDSHIQPLVKNAMPPYLLGYERQTMDPWKSSALFAAEGEPPPLSIDVPNPHNRYTGLHEQLLAYIRSEIAQGIYPSDQMLQQRARQISYGGDDPWDQTYADWDPMWLATVKEEAGMGTVPNLVYPH